METQDVVVATAQECVAALKSLAPGDSQAAKIDRIQLYEQVKRILSAEQATETHAFVQARQAQDTAAGIPASLQCKGIEAEVGFARGESAYRGSALTHTATALCTVLPNTLAKLQAGEVSEYHARVVAEQTNHLSAAHRQAVDAAIAHRLGTASTAQLRRLIQGHAYRLDRAAAEARAEQHKRRRRVCMDPAADGLVYVTAELPTHQGLAVMEALEKLVEQRLTEHTTNQQHTPEDEGTEQQSVARDAVMADVFVELLTGQPTATAVPAEILVVITDTALFGDADATPAWIPGHGPIPAGMAKAWLTDPEARTFLRRLYTRPADGQLVAMDSTRRRFPAGLATMLRVRDDVCATPWCNSPVKHADHRHPWARGGPTSWHNATGLCQRCNLRKEHPGWRYTGTPDTLTVTTPTGHTYTVETLPPLAELTNTTSDPPSHGINSTPSQKHHAA